MKAWPVLLLARIALASSLSVCAKIFGSVVASVAENVVARLCYA